ncbi:uncharacterized protein LOC122251654 [Penaeus japonicus]|uniref:uncharacterized protein LOC122251654 n=1 Tax=Penaeus japonicus TaxID=27405 RepID=UPI001C712C0C|nr:uncharacterized protein LOC122251654 [Penaeus japonicus]
MKRNRVALTLLTVFWLSAPVKPLDVSRKLHLEDIDAFLKGTKEESQNKQDIWSSLRTFCDLHCEKNKETLTDVYQSANESTANMQVGSRLFRQLYPGASSKRQGVRKMPSGWEVFLHLAATACDLHDAHRLKVQEENAQYENKNGNRYRRHAFTGKKPTYKNFLGDIAAFLPLVQWNIPSNRVIWLPNDDEK